MKFDATVAQLKFSIPPLPSHGLIFYVRDRADSENIFTEIKETLPPSLVVGPNITKHIITAGRDHFVVNVGFQPGGLYRFLGIPMNELLCKDGFDGVELFGNEMNDIHHRLQDAASFEQMKIIVESFLLKHADKLKQTIPIDDVFPLLIKERGLLNIDQLASHACLSIRQFERVLSSR